MIQSRLKTCSLIEVEEITHIPVRVGITSSIIVEELLMGEEVGTCPSCLLIIRIDTTMTFLLRAIITRLTKFQLQNLYYIRKERHSITELAKYHYNDTTRFKTKINIIRSYSISTFCATWWADIFYSFLATL
jgi:hypothetical protein